MLNENQKKYLVEEIESYESSAKSANRRAFWDVVGIVGSVALIGVSSALAHDVLPEYADALSIGLKCLGGVSSLVFATQTVDNNNISNQNTSKAHILKNVLETDNYDDIIVGKHVKK